MLIDSKFKLYLLTHEFCQACNKEGIKPNMETRKNIVFTKDDISGSRDGDEYVCV